MRQIVGYASNMRQNTVTPKIVVTRNRVVGLVDALRPSFENQFIAKPLIFMKIWISMAKNRAFEKCQKFVISFYQKRDFTKTIEHLFSA